MATSQIATNFQAVYTHNVFSKNNAGMNAALQRVSTGLKLNSAKDGGAQYAISEKMRERINSNQQASQNVQNDSALSRTASTGLDTTLSILKTLKARVLDSANDSNSDEDRQRIQTEVNQLIDQIDQNATTVKYNGKTLLSGNFSGVTGETVKSDTKAVLYSAELGTSTAKTLGALGIIDTAGPTSNASATAKATISYLKGSSLTQTEINTFTSATALSDVLAMIDGATTATANAANVTLASGLYDKNGDNVLAQGAGLYLYGNAGSSNNISDLTITLEANNLSYGGKRTFTFSQLQEAQDSTTGSSAKSLAFQIGEESGMSIALSISDMRASALGIGSLSTVVGAQSTAMSAISTIDKAISKVLDQQTSIGAVEQRLGYVADNLDTINENLQAADSALRDADMSKEISNFMKYSVLSQSAQYMLAQSHQNAFQVLNLLQ